jgi:WD40 repeat protein/tetratricopeptide (TPR) repeat protein
MGFGGGRPLFDTNGRGGHVLAVALSPDGKHLLAGTTNSDCNGRGDLWEYAMADGHRPRGPDFPLPPHVALNPLADNGRAGWMHNLEKEKSVYERKNDKDAPVWAVAFSPDGSLLMTCEGEIPSEDLRTGVIPNPAQIIRVNTTPCATVADVKTGKRVGSPLFHDRAVTSGAFSPDGKHAVTGSLDGTAGLWDLPAESFRPRFTLGHDGPVVAVAYSPAGDVVVTAAYAWSHGSLHPNEGALHFWEAATGRALGEAKRFDRPIHSLAFSPSGRTLLVGCGVPQEQHPGTAFFLDVATRAIVGQSIDYPLAVRAVAYGPDGQRVLATCEGRAAQVWEANPEPVGVPPRQHPDAIACSDDGRFVLCEEGNRLRRYEAATGLPAGPPTDPGDGWPALASADFRFVFVRTEKGGRLWDLATGKPAGEPFEEAPVALDPTGRRVAVAAGPEALGLRDAVTGKPLGEKVPLRAAARNVMFSPDGQTVLVLGDRGAVQLFDAATGAARGGVLEHPAAVDAAAFSPDGSVLATGCDDGKARLWDTATGEPRGKPMEMAGEVGCVAFGPAGRLLAVGDEDGRARVWDVRTQEPVGPTLNHEGTVRALAFSPDGHFVLTGGGNQTARLWEVSTGLPVGPPLPHAAPVLSVAFTPDGRQALTRSVTTSNVSSSLVRGEGGRFNIKYAVEARTAAVWTLPQVAGRTSDQLTRSVEALTGMTLDAEGRLRGLAWADRESAKKAAADLGGRPADAVLAWHRREAEAATGQPFAERWHLDRLIEAFPNDGELYSRRALALAKLGQLEPALADADRASVLLPDDWQALFVRGTVRSRARRWQLALDDFTTCLKLRPTNERALVERGRVLAELGRWQDAEADQAKAWERSNAPALVELARLELRRGALDKYAGSCGSLLAAARREFLPGAQVPAGHTLELDGDEALGVEILWLSSIDAAASADPDLEPVASRFVASPEPNPGLPRAVGAAFYRAGEYGKAVRWLTLAAEGPEGTRGSACLLLAMACRMQKDADAAKSWLKKAEGWMAEARKPPKGPGGESAWEALPWGERFAVEALHAEAEQLINDDSTPPRGGPDNAEAALKLAEQCGRKKQHAAATRLYGVAFALNPKLAEDPERAAAFDAACAAARAGCGRGADAGMLDDRERAELRTQARTWLRGLLAAHGKQLKDGTPEQAEQLQRTLANWQKDADLAGVRDGDALAKLPDAERGEWEKLWHDVEALRRQAAGPK